jgi:hypothetical protein
MNQWLPHMFFQVDVESGHYGVNKNQHGESLWKKTQQSGIQSDVADWLLTVAMTITMKTSILKAISTATPLSMIAKAFVIVM